MPGFRQLLVALGLLLPTVTAAGNTRVILVGSSAAADTASVQKGVNLVPHGDAKRWEVRVEPGVYRERVLLPAELGPVTLQGLGDAVSVQLLFACPSPGGGNGKHRCTAYPDEPKCGQLAGESLGNTETLLVRSDDTIVANMSIGNDACGYDNQQAYQSQAVQALGDRITFVDSRLLGGQDTLYTGRGSTRSYYLRTFINGSCDSIYGTNNAVFQDCEITIVDHVTAHRGDPNGGGPGVPSMYLFLNSQLLKPGSDEFAHSSKSAQDGKTDLGRAWCKEECFSSVVFSNTYMGSHISSVAWLDHMAGPAKECDNFSHDTCKKNTSCYCRNMTNAEHSSYGPGSSSTKRASWSQQLSDKEAAAHSKESVLRDWVPDVPGPIPSPTPAPSPSPSPSPVACDVDGCFARCVSKYGGTAETDAYSCCKGCAGMASGEVGDKEKLCRVDASKRQAQCLSGCAGSSSKKDKVKMCEYGCGFWSALDLQLETMV